MNNEYQKLRTEVENKLPTNYLEYGEERNDKGVKVGVRSPVLEVEGPTKELHAEQGEDEDEEEEQEEEGEDGVHGVEERDDEVPQAGPVLGHLEDPEEPEGSQDGQTELACLRPRGKWRGCRLGIYII